MAGFGFSMSDITAVGTFSWNLYKSCKHAGQEFCSLASDVGALQAALHELSDETSNPHSVIHHTRDDQRIELKRLMKACKSDLQDLEKLLAKYKSLKTADPRARDRIGFSPNKQLEIRVKLSGNTDRLNLFLTQLNTSALGRIEMNTEMHTKAFGEIKTKLDSIHQDVLAGKKDLALLTSMEYWGLLENELVDDNITEVDVELNKDYITEWLRKTRDGERLEDLYLSEGELPEQSDFTNEPLPPKSHRPQRAPKPEVTVVERPVLVSLEEMFTGITKKKKTKWELYDSVTGALRREKRFLDVPIKKGLKAGSKIKFPFVHDQVELHFIVQEKPHSVFRRDGDDIHRSVDISLGESLYGWSRTVQTIDGKQVKVGSSGPTPPAFSERFPSLGMPKSEMPTERGDLVVSVNIEYPISEANGQRRWRRR